MKKTHKKVFVCSRLRGEYEKNLEVAKSLCRIVAMMGNIPIAPHVYFTQFLKEEVESERKLGIDLGIELLRDCDEIWVFDVSGVSEGMEQEINFAMTNKIPIKYVTALDFIPPVVPPVAASSVYEYDEGRIEKDLREAEFD